MPEPVGGMSVLYNNVRYPESARADSLEGRVLLQFVVSERGEVIDPRVVQGIRPDLDQAALQALEGIRFFFPVFRMESRLRFSSCYPSCSGFSPELRRHRAIRTNLLRTTVKTFSS